MTAMLWTGTECQLCPDCGGVLFLSPLGMYCPECELHELEAGGRTFQERRDLDREARSEGH